MELECLGLKASCSIRSTRVHAIAWTEPTGHSHSSCDLPTPRSSAQRPRGLAFRWRPPHPPSHLRLPVSHPPLESFFSPAGVLWVVGRVAVAGDVQSTLADVHVQVRRGCRCANWPAEAVRAWRKEEARRPIQPRGSQTRCWAAGRPTRRSEGPNRCVENERGARNVGERTRRRRKDGIPVDTVERRNATEKDGEKTMKTKNGGTCREDRNDLLGERKTEPEENPSKTHRRQRNRCNCVKTIQEWEGNVTRRRERGDKRC